MHGTVQADTTAARQHIPRRGSCYFDARGEKWCCRRGLNSRPQPYQFSRGLFVPYATLTNSIITGDFSRYFVILDGLGYAAFRHNFWSRASVALPWVGQKMTENHMVKLTKRLVEGSTASVNALFLWDDEIQGFGVRIFASGKRRYFIQYRIGQRTRRATIGPHGVWTVELARKEEGSARKSGQRRRSDCRP
jgi:hypothetical protein